MLSDCVFLTIVWCCIYYAGTRHLRKIEGTERRNLSPRSPQKYSHAWKVTSQKILLLMIWLPLSLDIILIQLSWHELDKRIRNTCPTTVTGLWNILSEQWTDILHSVLERLVNRINQAVLCEGEGVFNEQKILLICLFGNSIKKSNADVD